MHQNKYKPFKKFVLRTPLLPLAFAIKLTKNKEFNEPEFIQWCKNNIIQEAIFLASPNLYKKLTKWLNGEITDKKVIDGLTVSLGKYLLRMATRCTPFGLFSGCSSGNISNSNDLLLNTLSQYTRHTRLDMNYLCALAQDLSQHPVIKQKIKYYPNSSLYKSGDKLRYVEYRYFQSRRTHHIVAVNDSAYLQAMLNAAENGAFFQELISTLVCEEISQQEASDFINDLINSQILVNELEPAITGPEFLDQLLSVLESLDGIDPVIEILRQCKAQLNEIDKQALGIDVKQYYHILENLKKLDTEFELKYMFQTDMMKPLKKNKLSEKIVEDVWEAIQVLYRFSSRPSTNNINQFREAFYKRYEDAEVPLLNALDIESGIGYIQNNAIAAGDVAPLVDDLILPQKGADNLDVKWNNIQRFLLNTYHQALKDHAFEIRLTENDLKKLPQAESRDDLPQTFSVLLEVINHDGETDNATICFSYAGGSGAANLLGRFSHADGNIEQYVKEIADKEKQLHENSMLAEIIHLPEARLGNILLRPVFRQYEIPYLARASVEKENQIDVKDLMVSVKNNRVVLRSKRLNKEIIPRLSTAHNYAFNALPVYQFLCDLQMQDNIGGVGFSWGLLEQEATFLPRVTYKNCIFSPARWNIPVKKLEPVIKIRDEEKRYDKFQRWRKEQQIPSVVLLSEGDNELYLNLESKLCLNILFSQVKNQIAFVLKEFLFDDRKSLIRNKEGSFTNEIILAFYKNPVDQ